MAVLRYENGDTVADLETIQKELAPLNVKLDRWAVDEGRVLELLGKERLTDGEKEEVLKGLDKRFETLKSELGYKSRDLIVLFPEVPNLEELLKKFDSAHTHADDEVRYVVDGEGVFGFTRPDGSQVELKVEALDFINVPKDTEHWFYLTEKKRIKAVRYFSGMEGWVPEYTGSEIRIKRG